MLAKQSTGLLSWACTLLQSPAKRRAAASARTVVRRTRSSSLEVCSPTASPRPEQWPRGTGLPHPHRQRLQVFATSWHFVPLRACWPCFMPDPLMGFTLQSFVPPAQPYAVSGACCPPDVQFARKDPRMKRRAGHRSTSNKRNNHNVGPAKHPSPTGRCSTRKSATVQRWFRPPRARSSPGSFPLQGVPPRRNERGLHRTSPHVVCTQGASDPCTTTPGCHFLRGWLVSLKTADPPGVSRLVTGHNRSSWTRFGSHLLGTRGASPSPSAPL